MCSEQGMVRSGVEQGSVDVNVMIIHFLTGE